MEFYKRTRAFVLSTIDLLARFINKEGEYIPYRIVEENKIETNGSWRIEYKPQPLYFEFIERHKKQIEELPEFRACMEIMRSDPVISKHVNRLVGTQDARELRTTWDYLQYFLLKQLSQLPERLEFNPEIFDNMYFDLEQFFYSENIKLQAFAPLHNFNSDVHEIELGDGLRIRKITTSELEELLTEMKRSYMIPPLEVLHLKYATELIYEEKKMFGDLSVNKVQIQVVNVNERFNKVITALRLFKSGSTGLNIIKTKPLLDMPIMVCRTRSRLEYKRFSGPQYLLSGKEVNEFRDFWSRFEKIDLEHYSSLNIAVERFNYAYERNRLEDKLIDYMIAFEALFSKKGETGEFRHKLSTRVSRLLKQNYEERKEIAKIMKEIYDKRSTIIHGERDNLTLEFINLVEDLLRASIKSFLEKLKIFGHDEVISRLDLD
jgi:hypothetical protein